jgi:tryptophan 2,3-dioxygenase
VGTSYWDYIRVEDLLRLQGGVQDDEEALGDHEVLFITVHQVFELWFKLVVRELATLRDVFDREVVPETSLSAAGRGLDRIRRIFEVAIHHWAVVESLDSRDYLDFRDRLFPASGFQSAQMREIELLLGLTDEERVGLGAKGGWLAALKEPGGTASPALRRVERRRGGRSLRDALYAWLHRTPIRGSQPGDAGDEAVVQAFLGDYLGRLKREIEGAMEGRLDERASPAAKDRVRDLYRREVAAAEAWMAPADPRLLRIRAAILFLEAYRELPLLSWPREVLGKVVEAEQAMLVFRQRHARMVERVIGRRVGTGGTSGVEYLDQTALSYRVFADLWQARTFLLRREALPPLEDPAYYEFAERR